MILNRQFLRSVQGQLSLMGVIYLGGIVLAIAALVTRSRFFEPHVREKYAAIPEQLRDVVRKRAAGEIETPALVSSIEAFVDKQEESARRRDLTTDDVAGLIYGQLSDDPELDPRNLLAKSMIETYGPAIRERIRRTLVLGNLEQRRRAVRLLSLFPPSDAEALELCRYALKRSRDRGETELATEAKAILERDQR
jgi:hypothetical protein